MLQLMLQLFSTADSRFLRTEQMATEIKRAAWSVSAPGRHRRSSRSPSESRSMENRRRITQDRRSQHNAELRGRSPSSARSDERELMHGLNGRLAGFIEKVRRLEHHNHLLERELEEIRGKAKPASCLEEEYGPELGKLRQLVRDITHQKRQIETEHRQLEDELSDLRRQQEQEARGRSDAEGRMVALKRSVGDAYQAKLELDKKAQALVDEIHFLKKTHEAEVSEMFEQIQAWRVNVQAQGFGDSGVTAALRDIRAQLEGHTTADVLQAEETFRSQFARLTEAAETKREALKATQQEIQEHRRRLQAKTTELDCAKGTRDALEKQLHDAEDRHKEEMIHYQNTIQELEHELINCKFDMSGYLREYQDLLDVKMALDVEILSYRKLICGEEARLSTMSESHISLPYIYHQSPIYTLPCLSRSGGPHRRAEPQYKFVEEIITETTREIEMSEFEETGSEEAEVGKDEQECVKRDKGSSEEEKDKDSREDGGEQKSYSEQDQVASVGNSMNGGDDGSPGEADGQKSKEESVEAEVDDNEGDISIDKNTQSKVLLSESLDEEENEHQKVHENTKEEKEVAVTVQKELSSKPEVPVEEELLENPDNGEKGDAEEASFIAAQAKKPDETSAQASKDSNKTQLQSSVGQVQDTVHSLASETAEIKSSLSIETEELSEKAQVSSSTTPKSEDKENRHAAPKESEAARGEDKVSKSIQGARPDSNEGQDKEPSLKSNAKSLPDVEDEKPNSGEKTQTVQTVLPKEKTPASAGIQKLHQGAPESSQGLESKPSEESEKTNDPQGKSEVEIVSQVRGKCTKSQTDGECAAVEEVGIKKKDISNLKQVMGKYQ